MSCVIPVILERVGPGHDGRLRAPHRVPAHLGDRQVQPALRLLHAGGGPALAPPRRDPHVRGDHRDRQGHGAHGAPASPPDRGGTAGAEGPLPRLVDMLAAVPGIEDIALSTNAVLLAPVARRLRDAGISRVNISLDSLRPERADSIARRRGTLARVMEGLDAAHAVGFDPIKINVVLMRGENDDEIADFAELSRHRPLHVRFIEVMPTESNLELSASNFLSCDEALARVAEVDALEPVSGPPGNGPATYFSFPGAEGHHRRHHADEPQLLQPLQPHAPHRRRPACAPVSSAPWRPRSGTPLRRGEPLEPLINETLRIKPEKHLLVQGSSAGSGGLIALSQTGG